MSSGWQSGSKRIVEPQLEMESACTPWEPADFRNLEGILTKYSELLLSSHTCVGSRKPSQTDNGVKLQSWC